MAPKTETVSVGAGNTPAGAAIVEMLRSCLRDAAQRLGWRNTIEPQPYAGLELQYKEEGTGVPTIVGLTVTLTIIGWSYRPGKYEFVGSLTDIMVTYDDGVLEGLGGLWGGYDEYPITIVWDEEQQFLNMQVEYGLRRRGHDALMDRVFA